MNPPGASVFKLLAAAVLVAVSRRASADATQADWKERRDGLVVRLRHLAGRENECGAAYGPLYRAALPWYELWGGRDPGPVDADMVSPEDYAADLAGALEHHRNVFAENPGAQFPLVFSSTLPEGRRIAANYWLSLPAGFPGNGRSYPLVIELHGSGWLGHKISFKRGRAQPGPALMVTPINMGGPWQIDFLNAYLDELVAVLPVDRDRIYLQGHSLGAMATWEWALDNPERFAAIAPRAGIGEPYRASRLKHLPAWVIHGENDAVIPRGYADEMVTALQAEGAAVRLSVLRGGEHNMPGDFDQGQILDWYLRQTRSPLPPPPDPRDGLHLNAAGFSPWDVITLPAVPSWKSQPLVIGGPEAFRAASATLFQRAHDRGELVDSPIRRERDAASALTTLWLAVPKSLHAAGPSDPTIVDFPATRVLRFFFRGNTQQAMEHLQAIMADTRAGGYVLSGRVWVTSLSIGWQEGPGAIAEYWAAIN